MVKQYKIDTVTEVTEKLKKAQSVILTNYSGLTVEEITDLRSRCRKENVEYKVIKNRLLKLALKNASYQSIDKQLKGPIGIAMSYKDAVQGAKVIAEYAKNNEKLNIKCGLMDKKFIDANAVVSLSKLPSKEVIYARIASGIQATISGLAISINAVVAQVARAISEVAKQKEGAQPS